jgi:hypothetical protein
MKVQNLNFNKIMAVKKVFIANFIIIIFIRFYPNENSET